MRNQTPDSSRDANTPTGKGDGLALAVIAIAQLMIILDATVVNVALPTIQKQLDFSPVNLQWVVNGYAVTFGGLLLLGGRAGDLFGRRRILMLSIIVFTAASLLGGLAQNEIWLIAARIAQGAGAAIIAPTSLSLLADTFPEGPRRNRAFGVYGAIAGGGGALGLLLGGVLTSLETWRWVFFINVPVGALVFILIPRAFKQSVKRTGELDLPGGLTATAALMSLIYGLSRAGSHSFSDSQAIISLALAGILVIVFIILEARNPQALMPLRIFSNRNRTAAFAVALTIGASIFSVFFFLTLFVQNILGFSPLKAGVGFLPLTAGIVIMAGIMSRIVGKVGPTLPMALGALVAGAGLALASRLSPESTYLHGVLAPTLIMAFGMGAIFVPLSLTAVSHISPEETGLASALLNVSQQIGGSLGLAILVNVSTSITKSQLAAGASQVAAITQGYSRAFEIAAGIIFVAFLIAIIFIRAPRQSLKSSEAGGPNSSKAP
jgi:EmrB/QacA subfamily drug resistance transporter